MTGAAGKGQAGDKDRQVTGAVSTCRHLAGSKKTADRGSGQGAPGRGQAGDRDGGEDGAKCQARDRARAGARGQDGARCQVRDSARASDRVGGQ